MKRKAGASRKERVLRECNNRRSAARGGRVLGVQGWFS